MTPTSVALALAVLGAALVHSTGQGTLVGSAAGLAVAAVSILGLGPGALLPLAIFVLGAGALTRIGRDIKEAGATAEANRGRRGTIHVAAKLGLPALFGVLGMLTKGDESLAAFLRLGYAAVLAGAFADTAATEAGPLMPGPTYALRGGRFERVRHGAVGGMSVGGLIAAAVGAIATSGGAAVSRLIEVNAWPIAAAAGFGAALMESILAPTRVGAALGHHGRNAAVSFIAATAAWGLWAMTRTRP